MSLKLTDGQLRQFEDEGYLYIPDVFDRSETDLLLREAHAIFACDRKEVVRERDGRTARTAFAAQHYNEAYRRLARPSAARSAGAADPRRRRLHAPVQDQRQGGVRRGTCGSGTRTTGSGRATTRCPSAGP